MNAIIDTSLWIEFFKGQSFPEARQALEESRAYLTPLIVAELLSGNMSKKEEIILTQLIKTMPVLETDVNHWIRVGHLRRHCRSSGLNISIPDAHIAQATIDLSGMLITRDKIFAKVASLIGFSVKTY